MEKNKRSEIGGNKMVKVQCILNYNDLQLGKLITTKDDPFLVTEERAEVLVGKNLVKVVEVIPDKKPVEEKAPEFKKQVAKKQNKRK